MFRRIAWLLTSALAISGCEDRRAGTEVGNPEITVTASFFVFDYMETETLALNFRVMGMSYSIAAPGGVPDSGKCWVRTGGTLVDFAAHDSILLPDTSIPDVGPWPHAEIILRTPDGQAGIPDTADIATWSNPRYVKFNTTLQDKERLVLFEMPLGVEYRLQFEEFIDDWWFEEKIWVPFNFNMSYWADGLVPVRGLRTRLDGKGAPYLLLSPNENAAAWNALNARMPECFYADTVLVR